MDPSVATSDWRAERIEYCKLRSTWGAVDLKQYDVVVLDAPTINDISELLRQICQSDANTHVVVATNYQTWKRAREIFRLGAHDYLYKTLIHRDLAHELDDLQRRSDR